MIMKDRKESMHTYYFIIMLSTYWAFFHTSPNKKACERKGLEKELLKKLVILPPFFSSSNQSGLWEFTVFKNS